MTNDGVLDIRHCIIFQVHINKIPQANLACGIFSYSMQVVLLTAFQSLLSFQVRD